MTEPLAPADRALMRVNGAYVHIIADWLDQHGLQAPELRAAVARFAPGDAVSMSQWQALLTRAAALRPGIGRGLEIGACVAPHHVGVLGYLVLASDNLGQALYAYQRFEALFYGVQLAQVTVTGEYAEISWPRYGKASLGLLVDETAIAALVRFMQKVVPQAPDPARVCFSSQRPAGAAVHEAFFRCPVLFDADCVSVRFPASYLAMALPTANPALRQLLDRQADAMALALPGSDPFALQVQQVIVRLLPEARVSLAQVAESLSLSARSLQRRLQRAGLSFQQVLDGTRRELAFSYLRDRSLSLVDITLLLGFAEQSSFNRIFRQWTATTPRHWRMQQHGSRHHD